MRTMLPAGRQMALLLLQAFHVLFLALHDWVPLGGLNDVAAVRRQDTRLRLVVVTLIQTLPFAFGLAASVAVYPRAYPGWLWRWLPISYGVLLAGQLRAWWVPYLLRPEPRRVARYEAMFGKTHTLLPRRNGLAPNTAHLLLHLATVATLCLLLA